MAENVIFLGAGASKSEDVPLQNELFKVYFSLNNNDAYLEMNNRLYKFFNDFFSLDIENNNLEEINFPTFEEILGILELSLDRGERFKIHELSNYTIELQQIKEDLIFLIAIVIEEKLKRNSFNQNLNKGTKFYRILIKRLINQNKILNTDFISLNYDIILDNVLTDIYKYDFDLDYGIEFTNFERSNDWKKPRSSRAVKLYKPHGSLNWLYCPTCISTTLTPKEKGVVKLRLTPQKCTTCGNEMIPIIIPPTFFKIMSNRYLQEIWYKSEKALKEAKNIYFCGYSFPDADIHIKYLLKRAEINGNSNLNIYIINNSKSENLLSRYERFFKTKHIYCSNQSFQDFCKRGI